MSLILEALKKSEAERRLGRAPDLLTPIMTTPSPRHRVRWVLVLVVGVVLVVTLSWWWYSRTTPPDVAAVGTAQPGTAAPPVLVTESHTEPAAPSPPRATPVPPSAAATIANVPLPQDPDFHGTERESIAVPAAAIPLPEPASDTTTREMKTPPQAPIPTVIQEAPTPTQPDTRSIATPTPADVQPELESLPRLAHLLPSEREGLPPLHLSMHVYDPEPGARFVLIDGKRYRQGDSIAQDIVVETIRSDGAVLSYRGRRFLLPRP